MERSEFGVLVKAMKAVYSDPKFITDQDAFNVWYEFMKDIPYDVAQATVYKYMATNKYPPTIADIREGAVKVAEPEQMAEGEAWALTYKAICNSAYCSKEEYEKLPEECRRAVGSPDMLREWASMNIDEVNTVVRSHFTKNYRVACDRVRELKQLPPATREAIGRLADSVSIDRIEKGATE